MLHPGKARTLAGCPGRAARLRTASWSHWEEDAALRRVKKRCVSEEYAGYPPRRKNPQAEKGSKFRQQRATGMSVTEAGLSNHKTFAQWGFYPLTGSAGSERRW